jgi:hypothetical protein
MYHVSFSLNIAKTNAHNPRDVQKKRREKGKAAAATQIIDGTQFI